MAKKEKSSVSRMIIAFMLLIIFAVAGLGIYNHITNKDGQSRVSNDIAEDDTKGRYLTIINETGQIINEVHIFVGEGTEINQCYQHNPDEKSFSIEIPKAYDKYDKFKVTIIDRYDLKYEKQITDVNKHGRIEVKITEANYIKQSGDWKKKMDKMFNNDWFILAKWCCDTD